MKVQLVIYAVLAACVGAEDGEYLPSIYGMQGLSISCDAKTKEQLVRDYEAAPGFDFLRVPRAPGEPIEVFVTAENLRPFKSRLEAAGIEYRVFLEDVGKVVEEQFALELRARKAHAGDDILKAFPRYDEITKYLKNLEKTRSDIVKTFSIGKSFENRDIVGVKISKPGKSAASGKPALVIDAGIHAREWIAPTTALFAIRQLAENASNSHILDGVDVYVVPCLNPDGYEFTHRNTATRMWRKTRSRNAGSSCVGVDANRNFEYKWMTVGASSYPCSEVYAGSAAFSEPETRALRSFIEATEDVRVYLTFHSYGNYLLHPWGFTEELPSNEPVLRCVAEAAAKRLADVRGTEYAIGSSTNVLYAAAGGSDDWAMGRGGAELSYTMELPGTRYGFEAPPSEILPIGVETFEAIKVFALYAQGKICRDL